ncbi:MAG: hypothetical protein CVV41_14345 [Candidatus Riflebacteria bacterium HGW-Riflebacteria-1]|jgi:class 3 adenylate cyclase|nr:MAG: hypothetical protein CVV41_14345 [Candidatus Riflebacteria bacterium HGW-Riflebacteria-1]
MAEITTRSTIKIERRVGFMTLLAVWLAVFVLPVVLLQLSLDYLFKLTRQANLRAMTPKMTNEMDSFRNDLEIDNYLQRSLEKFFADPASQSENDPAMLAKKLRATADLPVAGVISHSADTINVEHWFGEQLAREIPSLSRSLTRRWLVSVNEQQLFRFHSTAAEAATQALFRFVDPAKSKRDSDLFFRRMFALIAELPLVPRRITRSLSSRLGGPVYFYYHPFVAPSASGLHITGGCLLIFRGPDIAWRKVARAAVERSAPGLFRCFARLSDSLWERDTSLQKVITRFFEDSDGYHFQSTLSQSSMVDLTQNGSFMPVRLREFASRMPLLQISIAESQLQHPLFPYRSHISFAGKLFVLFGTLFLTSFFMFGFEFKAGITTKVVIGTAFILLLPFLLLLAGFVSWNQFNQVVGWYRLESGQQQLFSDFTDDFATFLISLQRNTYDLSLQLERPLDSGKDDEIQGVLARWLDQNPVVSGLRFDRKFNDSLNLRSPSAKDSDDAVRESTMRLVAATIMYGFDDEGALKESNKFGQEGDITSINSSFINDVVNRCGGVYQFASFGSSRRFSSIYYNYPGKYSIRAIITAAFERENLLREFAIRHFAAPSDIFHQFFLIREDLGVPRFYSLTDNSEVTDAKLLEHLNLALISGHNLYEPEKNQLAQIFAMSDMPLLMLTRGTIGSSQLFAPGFTILLLLYALLLMVLILLVFKLIYLQPIAEFIRVTESVAVGDYQQQVELSQTDEFGDLKVAFDSMIKGLEQRRRLSHFLSSEALRAVESDGDDSMAPGGIRLEASVAFVRLHNLQQHAQGSQAIFKTLGDFINEADRAAMRYGGVVDKLIEDTLMLVFRGNSGCCDHAPAAATAVLDLVATMRSCGFELRGAIASGTVVSGRIGSRLGKLDFTVIGDTVNLAARLKAEAHRTTQTGIIVAPSTIRLLRGRARVNFIERVEIKGKSREYPLYELTALRQSLSKTEN